jgi:hypothetical protein
MHRQSTIKETMGLQRKNMIGLKYEDTGDKITEELLTNTDIFMSSVISDDKFESEEKKESTVQLDTEISSSSDGSFEN